MKSAFPHAIPVMLGRDDLLVKLEVQLLPLVVLLATLGALGGNITVGQVKKHLLNVVSGRDPLKMWGPNIDYINIDKYQAYLFLS